MDNLDPRYLKALELVQNLLALSPDDGDVAARLRIETGSGAFAGEVLLSGKDLDALTAAVARLGEIADSMRKYGPEGPDLEDHFNQILWELDMVTPWDSAATGEATTTIPAPRVSPPSDAALWAAVHGDLATDLADIYNDAGLYFPTGSEDGEG
ncbi:hypothetical protein [Streptomyces lavendulocolor]|uniref:hypothetical protein n=1 Tax=Streptomyces lavendulocolor TaxID=67316 RepID=UPI003C2FAC1F